jgi:hypothetical protein
MRTYVKTLFTTNNSVLLLIALTYILGSTYIKLDYIIDNRDEITKLQTELSELKEQLSDVQTDS